MMNVDLIELEIHTKNTVWSHSWRRAASQVDLIPTKLNQKHAQHKWLMNEKLNDVQSGI